MAQQRTVVPLPDYERIFRVIYSVIEEHANAPHACIFFALVGAAILETKYKIECTPVAGAAAFAVHDATAMVSTFGRIEGDDLVSEEKAFHCWVEARGIVLDFMAPLFRESLKTYGHDVPVPRRMFQKPIREMSASVREVQSEGDFFLAPSAVLTTQIIRAFGDHQMNSDLANICLKWFTKPPKQLATNMGMRDNNGNTYFLSPKGPHLSGVW